MEIIPGIVQTSLHNCLGHPFDTVRTRLQLGMHKGMIHCFRDTVTKEGFRALYRGMSMPLVSHLTSRPFQFPLMERLKKQGWNPYLAGVSMGCLGSVWGTPLQLIMVNVQGSRAQEYRNSWEFIKQHYQRRGIRGFYHGFRINCFRDMVIWGSFVGHYNYLRDMSNQSVSGTAVAGGVASVVTWLTFIPLDHVKAMVQKERITPQVAIKRTLQQDGIRGFWRGVGPMVIKMATVPSLTMTAYEMTRQWLDV